MTKTILLASALLTAMAAAPAMAQGQTPAETIRRATSALPAALRDGATVVSYDAKGAPQILRVLRRWRCWVEYLHVMFPLKVKIFCHRLHR